MRKLVLSLFAATLLAVPFTVYAQEEELADPGVTPDSPFYFLEQIVESIDLFLTFDDDLKIDKELLYAEERLAELDAVSETADEEVLGELESAYNSKIANAIFLANKGENKENRLQVIQQAREKHVVKLQAVIGKSSEKATPALEKVMEKAQVKLDDIQNQIEQDSANGEQSGQIDSATLRDRVDDAIEKAGQKSGSAGNDTSKGNSQNDSGSPAGGR